MQFMRPVSVFFFLGILFAFGQGKTIAEKLGYRADAKLLIIHADDLGVSHSENMASIYAMENGAVNSASIMVPCPWFPEIAEYAKKNQTLDLGLHLTLTSEWDFYKWGPVSSKDAVLSLVNSNGYFFSSVDSLSMFAKPLEVELELRNQINKAKKTGIDITHLDTHMAAVTGRLEYTEAYIRLGREFKLPVLMDKRILTETNEEIKSLLDDNTVMMDFIHMASPEDYENGMEEYYSSLLRKLEPGLNCLLIHLAYDDYEMKGVTINHPYYASDWRQADFDFFTSEECLEIIRQEGIVLVSWRELRDKITRTE